MVRLGLESFTMLAVSTHTCNVCACLPHTGKYQLRSSDWNIEISDLKSIYIYILYVALKKEDSDKFREVENSEK